MYEEKRKKMNLYIVNIDRKPILFREWMRQLNVKLESVHQVFSEFTKIFA